MYTCDVQPAVVRVDFVHGVGGQKSRGRRTLMPVRACVRTLEIRASRLEKRDATGKWRGAVYIVERGSGGRWFLKYIDKRVEASSAVVAAG